MLDAVSEPTASAGSEPTRSSAQTRRVAAIDIGTNSTHLLVAGVDTILGTFSIEQAEKSTTRLGERDPDSGELTSAGMDRAFETLRRFRDLAVSHDVEQIVTAATSAVREAPNGREFLQSIQDGLGIDVDLVSGPEEARLIYLGVLSGMTFGDRPHLLLDIGGGSTELILADGRDARALTSTRVGAVRLQRDFVKDDPIPLSDARSCRPSSRDPWSLPLTRCTGGSSRGKYPFSLPPAARPWPSVHWRPVRTNVLH